MLRRSPRVLAILLLSPAAGAQGVLPLSGTYWFGIQQGDFGSPCPASQAKGAVRFGTMTFLPNGTFTAAGTDHQVCATGAVSDSPLAWSGTYSVATDGVLSLALTSPAPLTLPFHLRPDGEVGVYAEIEAGDVPRMGVLVRLSYGQTNASLAGPYHFANGKQTATVGGLAAECELGLVAFSGAGTFSVSGANHYVGPSGSTSNGSVLDSGLYAVVPDGTFAAGPLAGALSSDGEMFCAAATAGPEVALVAGVRAGSGIGAASFGGDWGTANFHAKPALGCGGSPEFTTEYGVYAFTPTGPSGATGTYDGGESEYSLGCASGSTFLSAWDATVGGDGSLSLLETPPPSTPHPGAVGSAGTYALLANMNDPGSAGISILVRKCPWPSAFGTGRAGSGGQVPALANSGGFPFLGNPAFGLSIGNALGGSIAVLGISALASPGLPLLGGTVWIDPFSLAVAIPLPLSGAPGAPGAGSASIAIPIPDVASLDGGSAFVQGFVFDAGTPGGYAMSAGLQVTLCR